MAQENFPEYDLAGIETIARGVCIRDASVLLCKAKGGRTTYLPGGHIEFGETGRDALQREMLEETGLECTVGRFMGVVENSFEQHSKPHAEINLVYELTLPPDAHVQAREDWIEFEWWKLADLHDAKLLPEAFNALASGKTDFAP